MTQNWTDPSVFLSNSTSSSGLGLSVDTSGRGSPIFFQSDGDPEPLCSFSETTSPLTEYWCKEVTLYSSSFSCGCVGHLCINVFNTSLNSCYCWLFFFFKLPLTSVWPFWKYFNLPCVLCNWYHLSIMYLKKFHVFKKTMCKNWQS